MTMCPSDERLTHGQDAQEFDEIPRRRNRFAKWLLSAWDWATDHQPKLAQELMELVDRSDDPDYPLWDMAKYKGLIGSGNTAQALKSACGLYPEGPRATGWEKQLWYSPVVMLPEDVWRRIHGALGWANRDRDPNYSEENFYLWSSGGNPVRFMIQPKMENDDDAET